MVVRLRLQRPVPLDQPCLHLRLTDCGDRAREDQRASHRRARQHLQLSEVPLPLPGGQVDDLTDVLLGDLVEARWRRHGVGDFRRPDKPLTLHPAIWPPLTSSLDHPLETVRTREVLRVRSSAERLPHPGGVTNATGPPDHPRGQATVDAPVLFNPCHATASELSRCHSGATMDPLNLPRIPYNPRSTRGSYWCARGDLNPHVLADTGT